MSLQSWLENGWLRRHKTSKKEIAYLLKIIERDLKDAEGGISDDWRFGIAYNAALKLCLRAKLSWSHFRRILSLRDDFQRNYYAAMCRIENWSVRPLDRKISGMLYEQIAFSKKPTELIKKELAD